MKNSTAVLPPFLVLDRLLQDWLLEDIGRGDALFIIAVS
jgi:nicotinate-nucleotide pyrophosphorylase (carboxylating)